jgi:parallel beta-helix repeat protein
VISGNDENGIAVARIRPGPVVQGTVVWGNVIGLDAGGSKPVRNGLAGLRTTDAGVSVGGFRGSGAGNVISANQYGILLSNSGGTNYRTQISGNYIGTDIAGTLDFGNVEIGVLVGSAPGTYVGGIPAQRNVISGNGIGVSIGGISHRVLPGGYNCVVQSNFIGLNATGTAALGNTTGVHITNSDNLIGGSGDASITLQNVISGNTEFGVHILHKEAIRNQVVNNCIGTDITGTRRLGNGLDGVLLADGTSGNTIRRNATLFNGRDGISLQDADKNSIRSNTSNLNGRVGVHLDGPSTANVVTDNRMFENGDFDAEDLSTGSGDAGTANSWVANDGGTSNPPDLL